MRSEGACLSIYKMYVCAFPSELPEIRIMVCDVDVDVDVEHDNRQVGASRE